MGRGDDRERNKADVMKDRNYKAFRAGASGGGTERERPDVIAGRVDIGRLIGSEVKARDPPVYITKKELTDLFIFCGTFGAEPWFDFFFTHNREYDHSFVSLTPAEVMTLEGTDGETEKSFRVREDLAKEVGHHREEFTSSRADQLFEQGVDQGHHVSLQVANAIPVEELEQAKEEGTYRERGVLREIVLGQRTPQDLLSTTRKRRS